MDRFHHEGSAPVAHRQSYRWPRTRCRCYRLFHLGAAAAVSEGTAQRACAPGHRAPTRLGLLFALGWLAMRRELPQLARAFADPQNAVATVPQRLADQHQLDHLRMGHRERPGRRNEPRLLHQSARQCACSASSCSPSGSTARNGQPSRSRRPVSAISRGAPDIRPGSRSTLALSFGLVRTRAQGRAGRCARRLRERNAAPLPDRHRLPDLVRDRRRRRRSATPRLA